jgi:hypothetical protein
MGFLSMRAYRDGESLTIIKQLPPQPNVTVVANIPSL